MVLSPSCLMVVMIDLLVTYTTGYVSHHFCNQMIQTSMGTAWVRACPDPG